MTDQVVASFDHASDRRARDLLSDLVWHLRRFVSRNDVTEDEGSTRSTS